MQKMNLAGPLLCCLAALAGGAAQAQTVTVGPSGYITAGPGATQQYTATVTGATGSTAVVWLVADVVGGNSTVGTISPTGLYTAPASIPAYTSVGIKAELAGNTKISGSQAITLLMAGPTITSVTPNPLPSGTVSITITGTGFLPGVEVLDGGVQLSTGTVTPTTITSSVYHPASATSTTFSARNSLSAFGNIITVPIGSAPVVSPSSVSVALSGTQQFKAPGATTWTAGVGAVTSSGLYTAPATMPASGTDTVTASNAIGSSTATITLKPPAEPKVSPSAVTVLLTKTQQFTAAGATSWNAVAGTVTSSGLYTAPGTMPASGTDTVTASNSVGSSSAKVTLQANVPPTISPASVSVVLTKTQQFTAVGATSWAAVSGTVTSSGLYTAPSVMPASGTDTVTAINSVGQSSATVTLLTNATPPVISPASVSVMLTKTQQFTAAGATSWAAVAGTVTSAGLYTAPSLMPASGTDTVTAINSVGQSSATVTLLTNVAPAISPSSVTLMLTKTQQFTAAGATSWKAVSGAVTSAGLYTAPASMPASGIDTVTAINAAGSSAATVTLVSNLPPAAVSPATVTLILGATQQFKSAGATSWAAVAGTVTPTGLYTAPAAMPASGTDTVTAMNSAGQSVATVTLLTNVPPTVLSTGVSPLPLGIFSTTVTGTGFTAQSQAQLGAVALATTYINPTTLNIAGFAGPASSENLTVSNGALMSAPLVVPVGVQTPMVSAAAARRFLEQAAFGPTPTDAANVQALGFQGWINQQLAMPVMSNYNALVASGASQGGLAQAFLTNAVTTPDQLRQRVALALSEIFTISITKIIWDGDMIPYEQILINDAFTNYSQILSDVTLSPGMGEYLDMANNAAANPAAGTVANENYAREIMQLFSVGDVLLNQDGTPQVDSTGAPLPTYLQPTVAELARVFTGWTYTQGSNPPNWGAYINSSAPMVPYPPMHDFGSKTLINGYVAPAGLTTQQDLQGALTAISTHPNVAPFISKQLIEHLVKSNPTPAYVQRVAQAFSQSNGDMPTVVTAILLDQEARANDAGGNDLPTDGHLQEPALFVPGIVRALSGQMTTANYYQQALAQLGQDIYDPVSVFSYFSPGYLVPGAGGLLGPEFEIDTPNAAILRENLVAELFSQWSNPVQNYGPGTTIDLTPYLQLAATPAALVNALDLALTHGTMPAAMKQIITTAVTADQSYGALNQVEGAVYLILQSGYYNVWH